MQRVQPGELVRASTINGIIDRLPVTSHTLDVQNTDTGAIVNLPSRNVPEPYRGSKLFQCAPSKLDGYPYAAVNMGSTLEDCLRGVVVHEGGAESSPVSAAVVYQNSAGSPQQNHLSGYVLSSGQFGNDAAIGSTGWLSTMMEWPHDQFCRSIRLGVWKAKGGRFMAFTNCEELSDAGQELTVQLVNAGAVSDDLSGMVLEGATTLVRSVSLSVETESAPVEYMSKPLARNDGEVHMWLGADQSGVEWKADLVCYNTDSEEETSEWCWKVWLGPDSEWKDEHGFVTAQCQGGDEFAISATKISALSEKDGTCVMASEFGGYDVYFNSFRGQSEEPISPEPAYLVLKYDHDQAFVEGSFATTPDDTQLSADGILLRNTFIASAGQFMPSDPQPGKKAPESLISRGTWGFLDRSPLKPDSYLPDNPQTTAKSLEWKTPRSDQDGPVESHALQLYGFSQNGGVSSVLSTDEYVIRRRDDDGNKWIEYAPLSAMDVPPDAEVSDAQQSSIAWLSGDYGKVLELYNFHETPVSDITVLINDVEGEYRVGNTDEWFVVKYGNVVDYRSLKISVDLSSALSGVSAEVDVDTDVPAAEQSSICWLSVEGEPPCLELYNFNETPSGDIGVEITAFSGVFEPVHEEWLVTKNPDGGDHVDYKSLKVSVDLSDALNDAISSAVSSAISSISCCSCDMSAILTAGTKIARWTKDGTSWTDIYAPSASGGGGDCSCSMSAVIGAETYQDTAYRTNTQVAQFKDCQGRTTNVYAPDSVRFQGNVGAQTKTGWNNIFKFQTMTSSNVQVICNGDTIQIGAFYI